MKLWKMGFVGASTDEMANWVAELDADSFAIPFFGSGKEVALLAQRPDVSVESWDVQHISALAAELFTSTEVKTNIDEPKLQRGWTFKERPFEDMEDRTAGLVDYIANNGTSYERLALVTAIARCTMLGRLDQWDPLRQATSLWEFFQKRLIAQEDYINLPGSIVHHEADFYSTLPSQKFDVLYIDPPKIVSSSDVYSKNFVGLNRMVAPSTFKTIELDKWTKYDYTGKMRGVLDAVDSDLIVLAYTSGVRPGLDSMRTLFEEYGELIDEVRFLHRRRYDYGLVFRRTE